MADLTPDEGAPLEAAFVSARPGARLPGRADHDLAERIELIGERAGGFVYCVSLTGVTGAREALPASLAALVSRVKKVSPLPVAVGFGVSKPEHVRAVAKAVGSSWDRHSLTHSASTAQTWFGCRSVVQGLRTAA